ncbi:iron-siderophore ABC transporter substrate-binding protein [Nodosilinea sp. LEGE 07088]|uniref:iron-siderophore ABC transporter substrate-binding protein n=1 Tax=Nodosilinea sp. LEGE 07088 TaxID=2777968 RepID=UPI00187FE319|nr:iron-siderophore ABC transporter substrate-binding protein [Nodosilinea sp. LEGE 07088]MBE9136173.1 iron-siderophore ABC transporter substrate-binding protein [Nodosilinea sp. LEGE 07088]
MNLKTWLLHGLLVVLVAVGTIACQTAPTANSTPADCRMVQHTLGETCVPMQPSRVVALDHTAAGNLLSLGVMPVGVASNLLPQLAERLPDVPRLGQSNQINLEALVALQPDLIIGAASDLEGTYDKLSAIAPTVAFDMQTTADWQRPFRFHAQVLGLESRAEAVLNQYQQRVKALRNQVGSPPVQVSLVRVMAQSGQIGLYLKNCFGGSILADIGFARPPSQDSGTLEQPLFTKLISREALPEADGDVILLFSFGATPEIAAAAEAELERLKTDPLWQSLRAVQQKQVYGVGHYWGAGNSPLAAEWVLDDIEQYLLQASP